MVPASMSTLVMSTSPDPFGVMAMLMLVSVPSAASVVPARVTPAVATLVSNALSLMSAPSMVTPAAPVFSLTMSTVSVPAIAVLPFDAVMETLSVFTAMSPDMATVPSTSRVDPGLALLMPTRWAAVSTTRSAVASVMRYPVLMPPWRA